MSKTVPVSKIDPNPYRDITHYKLRTDKIVALKESIEQTTFWGNVVVREVNGRFELAYGHHRLAALKELKTKEVEVIVRKLSNAQMIKMMSRENMEEWRSSAGGEMETVRAVIVAYTNDELDAEMPKVPKNLRSQELRWMETSERSKACFTIDTVAKFLGWTDKKGHANETCRIAFKSLDLLGKGGLHVEEEQTEEEDEAEPVSEETEITEEDFADVTSRQMEAIHEGAKKIKDAQEKIAAELLKSAESHPNPSVRTKRKKLAAKVKAIASRLAREFTKEQMKLVKEADPEKRASIRSIGREAKDRVQQIALMGLTRSDKKYDTAVARLAKYRNAIMLVLNDDMYSSILEVIANGAAFDLTTKDVDSLRDEVVSLQKRADLFARILKQGIPSSPTTGTNLLRIVG